MLTDNRAKEHFTRSDGTDVHWAALEQWHHKTRALTQGMMQELLTDRTRLA